MTDAANYTRCPKCQHTPLTQDQSLPAACPTCGLILAKFAAPVQLHSVATSADAAASAYSGWRGHIQALIEAVRYIPPRVDPALFWARAALLLLFTLWGLRLIWLDFRSGEMGSSFLHGSLLVFHEAVPHD